MKLTNLKPLDGTVCCWSGCSEPIATGYLCAKHLAACKCRDGRVHFVGEGCDDNLNTHRLPPGPQTLRAVIVIDTIVVPNGWVRVVDIPLALEQEQAGRGAIRFHDWHAFFVPGAAVRFPVEGER